VRPECEKKDKDSRENKENQQKARLTAHPHEQNACVITMSSDQFKTEPLFRGSLVK